MGGSLRDGQLIRWAPARYRPDLRGGLASWIDGLLASEAVSDILTDPALPTEAQIWIAPLASLRPDHRKRYRRAGPRPWAATAAAKS